VFLVPRRCSTCVSHNSSPFAHAITAERDKDSGPSDPLTLARVALAPSLRQVVRSGLGAPSLLRTHLAHRVHSTLSLPHSLSRIYMLDCCVFGRQAWPPSSLSPSRFLRRLAPYDRQPLPYLTSLAPASMHYRYNLFVHLADFLPNRNQDAQYRQPHSQRTVAQLQRGTQSPHLPRRLILHQNSEQAIWWYVGKMFHKYHWRIYHRLRLTSERPRFGRQSRVPRWLQFQPAFCLSPGEPTT